MFLLLSVGGALQYQFGMVGLMLTEFMILAVALLSIRISRMDFRQVLRVRRSSGLEWLGSLLVYLSAFFGAATVSYLLSWLVPRTAETSAEINGFILSGGFIFALVGVTILPGICEEAWHRGYLLSSLRSIKSVVFRVIIMGLAFGLFHFDPTRFLQTMILGFALSFMRIKTDNMLPSIAFHCLNNLISVVLVFVLSSLSQSLPEQAIQVAEASQGSSFPGMLIFLAIIALFFCVLFFVLARKVFGAVDRRRTVAQVWAPPS
jgi:membrane protease YdiL (CAAX protease family)